MQFRFRSGSSSFSCRDLVSCRHHFPYCSFFGHVAGPCLSSGSGVGWRKPANFTIAQNFIFLRVYRVSGVWTGYCESGQSGLGAVPSPGPDSVLVQFRPGSDPGLVPGSEYFLLRTPVAASGSGWVPVPSGFGSGSECVLFRSLNPAAGTEGCFRPEASMAISRSCFRAFSRT